MISTSMVVLQTCAGAVDAESGSCTWTCPASHENRDIDVKVEMVTDIQEEEEDPLLITIPVTRAECEVGLGGSVCTS
jgi:hypothetical protein